MEQRNCPYLAVLDDTKTCKNFPYEGHACHLVIKPVPVKLSYQRSHCLNESYTQCAGYINGWESGFPKFLRQDNNPVLNKVLSKLRVWKEKTPQKESEKVRPTTEQAPIVVETEKLPHIEVEKIKPKTEQAPISIKTEKTTAIKEVHKKRDWYKALAASFALFKEKIRLNDRIKSLGAKLKVQKETEKKQSFIKSLQSKLVAIRLTKKEQKSAVSPRQKAKIIAEEEKQTMPDRVEIIQQYIAPSSVQQIDVEREQELRKESYQEPVPERATREKLDLRKEYNLRDELKSQRRQKKSLKIELPWQKDRQDKQDRKGLLAGKGTKVKQNKADGLNFFQRIFSRKKKVRRKWRLKKVFQSKAFRLVSLLIILIILFAIFPGQVLSFGRDVRVKVDTWISAGMETIEAILATNTPGAPTLTLSPSEIAGPSLTPTSTQTPVPSSTSPGSGTPGVAPFIYLTKTETPEP
ncbi:MAG: hypothetical protein P1P73_01590 [Brevefilum sp.]|nr:hypothetical protein [Brevefilum sp.]